MRDLYGLVIYLESILNQGIILIECVRVLWTQRAQHEIGSLSTHRGEIFPYPDIKIQSRITQIFQSRLTRLMCESSRDSHNKIQSRCSSSFCISYIIMCIRTSRDCQLESSRDYQHMHTQVDIQSRSCYNMYIHIEITVRALCTRNATRSRQTSSVGMTCPYTKWIGRRRSASSQTNISILAYVSGSCRMCCDSLAGGTFHRGLCVTCQIVTSKLDRKYYNRLQKLYSGCLSDDCCSVVLPRTLSCLLYTYYNSAEI